MEGGRGDPHPGQVALHVVSKAWPARREKPRRGFQLPFPLEDASQVAVSGFLMTRSPYFGSYRRFGRQQTLNSGSSCQNTEYSPRSHKDHRTRMSLGILLLSPTEHIASHHGGTAMATV